jgi:hypothetical protein
MTGWMLVSMLLAVGLNPQQSDPAALAEPIPLVTITALHEAPWDWDGRRVRVVGTFDQCFGRDCQICDAPENLLRTSDDDFAPWDSGACAGISFVLGGSADEQARYNTVLIEAEYDATCSGVQPPSLEPADEVTVCGDRASEFVNSAIIDLVEIHPARSIDTRWEADRNVVRASEPFGAVLVDAMIAGTHPVARENIGPLFPFLWTDEPPEDLGAGVCECVERSCSEANWPTRDHQLNRAWGNPYICYFAGQREDGSWFFPVQ